MLQTPMDDHMISMIDNGQAIIRIGADEVLVTGVELLDVYKALCRNN